MALTSGSGTSEFTLAKLLVGIGVGLQGVAATLAVILPNAPWVAIVISIAGAVKAVAGALGYMLPRAELKREDIRMSPTGLIAKLPSG